MVESNKKDVIMKEEKKHNTRQEAKKKISEQLGEITSKDQIKETNYGLVRTNRNTFGMVRDLEDPTKMFDFANHKDQYNKLADFVVKFVQDTMVQTYNLQELWIPEK